MEAAEVAGDAVIGAVVFDLYGTLVHEFPRAEFYRVVREMAREVGADPDRFERGWSETALLRQTGAHPTVEENLVAICSRLGVRADRGALARAMARRSEMYDRHFRPRDGAEETLAAVKRRGFPIALISMCAPDTPALWRATSLARYVDVEVFSSEVGLRKPDPAIYLLACERLGVDPSACLYVGDGAYGELTGAEAVGMTAYLLADPTDGDVERLVPERDAWDARTIADLREILAILDGGN